MMLVLLLALLAAALVPAAIAQSAPVVDEEPVGTQRNQAAVFTLEVAKDSYTEGDTVVVSGRVNTLLPNTPLIIQFLHATGAPVQVAQIEPAEDGRFVHTIVAQGPLWKRDGEYSVRVTYGRTAVETTFDFAIKKEPTEVGGTYEVPIEGAGTFDVHYRIRDGTLSEMHFDQATYKLVAVIQPSGSGQLVLDLQRDSIDALANGCEGEDEIYIVMIDGISVPYTETDTTARFRTISVDFQSGDRDIEIIGTCVIPEFGGIAAAVLATSVAAVLVTSRSRIRIFP